MMRIGPAFLFSAVVLAQVVAGRCDKGSKGTSGAAAPIVQKDGVDGLKALFEAAHAACTSKDFAKGRAITMSVIPNKEQLKKLFKDEVPADQIAKLVSRFSELPPS